MAVKNVMPNKTEVANEVFRLWEPLTDGQRQLVMRHLSVQRFKKNELIYREDEQPENMFILIEGKVKVFKEGLGGRQQIIRVLRPVELFAYRAYFADETYKTSASAFEPSVIASLPLDVVLTLMHENTNVSISLIHYLSSHLGQSYQRTVTLTQKHIRGRLAEALLFLEDCYGVEEDGSTLSIYLSREDMASLSNMTTSNAIRTLSAFASEGLVAIDGRKIKVLNEKELRHISQMG